MFSTVQTFRRTQRAYTLSVGTDRPNVWRAHTMSKWIVHTRLPHAMIAYSPYVCCRESLLDPIQSDTIGSNRETRNSLSLSLTLSLARTFVHTSIFECVLFSVRFFVSLMWIGFIFSLILIRLIPLRLLHLMNQIQGYTRIHMSVSDCARAHAQKTNKWQKKSTTTTKTMTEN